MTKAGENPPAAPKRFFKSAALAEEGNAFVLTLDGRPARTRAGRPLSTPSHPLAAAIAAEWKAQGNWLLFPAMPMTRFRMTVIDRGDEDADLWRRGVLDFLASDLLCYRAEAPAALIERQARTWDPILAWAASEGVALKTGAGVGFIAQPAESLAGGARLLEGATADMLIAIKSAAEITGSAVIALALWRRAFEDHALFDAARTDERFQAEKWGFDAEAEARARRLKADFLDAARYLSLAGAG
ncbi:MAG: ATP12 family protein [Parvularculaceae bacterium]